MWCCCHYCHYYLLLYLIIKLLTYYLNQPITLYTSVQDDGAVPISVDHYIAGGP